MSTPENPQNPPSRPWARRVRKGAYYGLNAILPLSETRYALTTVGTSLAGHLRRIKQLSPTARREQARQQPILCFTDAVAASGQPIPVLQRNFRRRKQVCLVLTAIPVSAVTGLASVTLLSGLSSPWLLLKVLIIVLALLSLACLPFLQALICTWRLWQLREQRASVEERGGFMDFVAENGWFRCALRPGL